MRNPFPSPHKAAFSSALVLAAAYGCGHVAAKQRIRGAQGARCDIGAYETSLSY